MPDTLQLRDQPETPEKKAKKPEKKTRSTKWPRTLLKIGRKNVATHRPRELEGDRYLSGLVDFIWIVLGALQRKGIPTENSRRSRAVDAVAGVGDLHLVLLQAHVEVSVALVAGAAQVFGVPGAVAALPVRQLAVDIFHGDHLQLEIAGGPGHLETTGNKKHTRQNHARLHVRGFESGA